MPRKLIVSLSTLIVLVVAGAANVWVTCPAVAADAPATPEKKAAATFEVYKDKAGEYRWRLRMQNTKVIATSGEGYSSKKSCQDAIESVKKNAPDAAVEEKSADAAPPAKE